MDWKVRRPVAGLVWESCPLCLIAAPSWRRLVDRYIAAKVSPLAGFPTAYTAWAYRGLVELHNEVRAEERRKLEEATSKKPGPPRSPVRSKTG